MPGGGSLFLGNDDSGSVTGLEITNKLLTETQDIARNRDPHVAVRLIRHGKHVLEVRVQEGRDKPYRCSD